MKTYFKTFLFVSIFAFFIGFSPLVSAQVNQTTGSGGGINETTGPQPQTTASGCHKKGNLWVHPDMPLVMNGYATKEECEEAHPPSSTTNNQTATASSGSGKSIKLTNPLGTVNTIPEFVKAVLDIVMKIGVPLVALAIIYTGYLFIAAQGKPEELEKAKKALVYVFIGSMILLGAYVIAEAIIGTVNAIRGK